MKSGKTAARSRRVRLWTSCSHIKSYTQILFSRIRTFKSKIRATVQSRDANKFWVHFASNEGLAIGQGRRIFCTKEGSIFMLNHCWIEQWLLWDPCRDNEWRSECFHICAGHDAWKMQPEPLAVSAFSLRSTVCLQLCAELKISWPRPARQENLLLLSDGDFITYQLDEYLA